MHFLTTKIGTPLYMSPEQVKQKPYDFKVDIWGVGCWLYQLSKFWPPFSGDNLIALGNSIGTYKILYLWFYSLKRTRKDIIYVSSFIKIIQNLAIILRRWMISFWSFWLRTSLKGQVRMKHWLISQKMLLTNIKKSLKACLKVIYFYINI